MKDYLGISGKAAIVTGSGRGRELPRRWRSTACA